MQCGFKIWDAGVITARAFALILSADMSSIKKKTKTGIWIPFMQPLIKHSVSCLTHVSKWSSVFVVQAAMRAVRILLLRTCFGRSCQMRAMICRTIISLHPTEFWRMLIMFFTNSDLLSDNSLLNFKNSKNNRKQRFDLETWSNCMVHCFIDSLKTLFVNNMQGFFCLFFFCW